MAVANDPNIATDVRVSGAGTWTWANHFTNASADRIKNVGTNNATRQLTTNAVGGGTNGGITMQNENNVVLDLRGVRNLVMGKVWRVVSATGVDSQTQCPGTYIDISDGTTVQNHGSGNISEVVAAYKADKTSKIMCNSGGFLWGSVQPGNAIDGVQITFATGVGGDFHIGYNPAGYVKNVDWHILGTANSDIILGAQAIWANNRPVPLDGFAINSTKGNAAISFFAWNANGVPWLALGNNFWMIYRDLKYNVAFNSRPDAIKRSYRRAGFSTPGSASYWFGQGNMACGYLWVDPYTDMNTSGVPGNAKTYIRKINYLTTGTGATDGNSFDIVAFRYTPTVTDALGAPLQNAHVKVTCSNANIIAGTAYGLQKSPIAAIGYTGADGQFVIDEPATPNYNTNTSYYTDSGVFKTHAPSGKFHKAWETGTKYIITNDSRGTVGYNIGPVYGANEFNVQIRRSGYVVYTSALDVSGPISAITSLTADQNYNASASTAGIFVTYASGVTTVTPSAGTYTLDQIYKAVIDFHFTTANTEVSTVIPVTQNNGALTFGSALVLAINSTHTLQVGTNCTALSTTQNLQFNGAGLANADFVYTNSNGQSFIAELTVSAGSSIYIGNSSTGITKLFQSGVSAGTYRAYYEPGTAPVVLVARELYPFQRFSEVLTLTPGLNTFTPIDIEDVGITEPTLATVQAYTAIEGPSKFYDRTAAFRLTEQGIKLGQMVTRSGKALETGAFSHVINKDAASVYSVTGSVITTKAIEYAGDDKYDTEILTPPATLTANTTEVITIQIEDANGDSQVSINGGDGTFQLWKVTTATATNDYATGTLLATVGNGIYRFIGVAGFDIVGVDVNSNIRRRSSMAKGIYTQAFYVGDQIQLAQAPQVIENGIKLDVLTVNIEDIKGTGFTKDKHSLTKIWRIAKFAASVASWFKR